MREGQDFIEKQELESAFPAVPSAQWHAIFEIALCSGVPTTVAVQVGFASLGFEVQSILASAKLTALFIFIESAFLLGLIFVFQALRATSIKDLGVIPARAKREISLGIVTVPLLFGLSFVVAWTFQEFLPRFSSPRNPLLDLIQTRVDLILFVLLALWAGGIKEELQRAFILNRFKLHFSAPLLGLILWSLAFGAGHAMQGVDSSVGACLYGLLFGAIYLWRRCILAPVISHSLYDVSVLMGYWFLNGS